MSEVAVGTTPSSTRGPGSHEVDLAQRVADGERVQEFVTDPAVSRALKRLEGDLLVEFRAAADGDKRTVVWAKMQFLEQFATELLATKTRSIFAAQELERARPKGATRK